MASIQIPYAEESLSGAFSYDITNITNPEITLVLNGLSAGAVNLVQVYNGTEYVLKAYSQNANDIIRPGGRKLRLVGVGATLDFLSVSNG